MFSFLRCRFRWMSQPRPSVRRTAPTCRPGMEALDGRTLLSVTPLHIVSSPTVNVSNLDAVAEIASNDVWAVGGVTNGTSSQPLAEKFNGTSWSVVPTPTLSSASTFNGVAGVAANNVWAVGSNGELPLIEHFNGTSWSIVAGASVPSGSDLESVTAISANDVWAVGSSANQNLVEFFNGTSWSVVSAQSGFSRSAGLASVSADSSSDVWAVGGGSNGRGNTVPQVEHFNGTSWSAVSVPADGVSGFQSVVALAPNNVWAVGESETGGTLIEHFNGTRFSIVSSPNPGVGGDLFGVAAVSASNVWAVGRFVNPSTEDFVTLTENFNGTSWSIVSSPNVTGTNVDYLLGVTASRNGDVVAVGTEGQFDGGQSGLVLANNEPASKTHVAAATSTAVVGTFADLFADPAKGLHGPA